jgi:putative nucleotidyltransferase with HDIG domain
MSASVIHNFNRSGSTSAAIGALARMMAARDGATHQHAQRVQHFAVALAAEIGIRDDRMLQAIEVGALLHDIGKLGVPDSLLAKPGPLTPAEYERVKQHSAIGADLLSTINFPGPLSLVVRHHHENWDGSGYPDGLRGENIPIGARVLAVVDCYDALTSDRPYRAALPHCSAASMLDERSGSMYDPQIATAFLSIVQRLLSNRVSVPKRPSPPRERVQWPLNGGAV